MVPSEWDDSFIFSVFKGNGEAVERGNYCGLKLTEHVLKMVERILEVIIRNTVTVDDMQFGFMPGHVTTDATFILRKIQEKYIGKNCNLYLAFVDLKKPSTECRERSCGWL